MSHETIDMLKAITDLFKDTFVSYKDAYKVAALLLTGGTVVNQFLTGVQLNRIEKKIETMFDERLPKNHKT